MKSNKHYLEEYDWGWRQKLIDTFFIFYNSEKEKGNLWEEPVLFIKEKYAQLDIECYPCTDQLFNVIQAVEGKSWEICMECWKPWKIRADIWWRKTLCWKHYLLNRMKRIWRKLKNLLIFR